MAILDGLAGFGAREIRQKAEAIARDRDAVRKKEADADRHRLQNSQSVEGTEEVLTLASQFDRLKTEFALGPAISWALQMKDEAPCEKLGNFSSQVDSEVCEPPPRPPHPEPVLEVRVGRVRDPQSR